jgi:hypothetical protein
VSLFIAHFPYFFSVHTIILFVPLSLSASLFHSVPLFVYACNLHLSIFFLTIIFLSGHIHYLSSCSFYVLHCACLPYLICPCPGYSSLFAFLSLSLTPTSMLYGRFPCCKYFTFLSIISYRLLCTTCSSC